MYLFHLLEAGMDEGSGRSIGGFSSQTKFSVWERMAFVNRIVGCLGANAGAK